MELLEETLTFDTVAIYIREGANFSITGVGVLRELMTFIA
jgi:hypothetical protein